MSGTGNFSLKSFPIVGQGLKDIKNTLYRAHIRVLRTDAVGWEASTYSPIFNDRWHNRRQRGVIHYFRNLVRGDHSIQNHKRESH